MKTWDGVLGWEKTEGVGRLMYLLPSGIPFLLFTWNSKFPSEYIIHQDFLRCSSSFWETGRRVTEHGRERTSMGQDLQKSPVPRVCHGLVSNRAAEWGSPLSFVIRSCWLPSPRISPSSLLCTHISSHTALLPLNRKISSHPSLCSLIIPRLDQEEAEGHVLSL